MNLFQLGDFTLASGRKSQWKIECDALTEEDIETFAWLISSFTLPFGSVEGVPTGGLRIAAALQKYVIMSSTRHLIVDDVLTTGGSMEKTRDKYLHQPDILVMGVVLFARGPCPLWVKPVFMCHTF